MSYECLISEVEAGVMTLRLNRPDRLNAMSVQMMEEFMRAINAEHPAIEIQLILPG